MSEEFAEVFREVQKACTPAIWSRGVTMVRGNLTLLREASSNSEELHLRLVERNRALSPRVRLFLQEGEWLCDCGSDDDPCVHVAAAVIAYKQGKVVDNSAPSADVDTGVAGGAVSGVARLEYRFKRVDSLPLKGLLMDRFVVGPGYEERITTSLTSYVGGVNSGRIDGPLVPASKEDYAIDAIVRSPGGRALDRQTLGHLITALEPIENITLDGDAVRTSRRTVGIKARLIDDGEGFRLQRFQTLKVDERFAGGFVLSEGFLRPIEHSKLTPQEDELLNSANGPSSSIHAGHYFGPEQAAHLVSDVLPSLIRKIPVDVLTTRLPETLETPPRILLKAEAVTGTELSVVAQLVYGDPPVAHVNDMRLSAPNRNVVVIRDSNEERALLQKLSQELQLQTGRAVTFHGFNALDFIRKSKNWDMAGNGRQAFTPRAPLVARLESQGQRFDVHFESADGSSTQKFSADPAQVFRAWREGADVVPLLGGGYAPLPRDWLRKFGKRVQEMLEARDLNRELPAYRMPELAQVFSELGVDPPAALKNLRDLLDRFEGIPSYPLPADLTAELRAYQKIGVNWLCFLRDSNLGGLLADDMGLGKTLQALCAIRGRTLIVAPTSVLYNWANELAKFRPSLKVSMYYGTNRTLKVSESDVVLTTYALVRNDQEILVNQKWDTLILDEAQTIKNPHSQISRAVHRFQGGFRMSLSGTPVENRLDDLWSQFQFVNPGMLGTYESFQEKFVSPIGRGDADATHRLRSRVKPFILRRLKKQVAPELPARTESVLRCELASSEREVYDAVLAATRTEVVAKLKEGGSVIQALEALLRLRQACCHMNLVPGQKSETSAKLDLLIDTLEESLSEGHKSLIFSQWTSFLDLIEARLRERGIVSSRIDGSTKNRAEVVKEFQSGASAPPVMLLSLKAGGVGLTLTAADHVFIMDPWWNPSVEDQAADRAHRIGQQNPVLIHRLIANETVEEKILELQKKKKDLAQAVLDGGEGGTSLTRQDLIDLLS